MHICVAHFGSLAFSSSFYIPQRDLCVCALAVFQFVYVCSIEQEKYKASSCSANRMNVDLGSDSGSFKDYSLSLVPLIATVQRGGLLILEQV